MSTSPDALSQLLPKVKQLAQNAGEAILEIYQQDDLGVSVKSDDSPLTLADLAAHRCIVAGLTQLTPEWPILSEESAEIDWAARQQWQTYWLVDPLDGTKEFVKRNGEFTVNIALIHQGQSILGVVYAPVLNRFYYAAQGVGAFEHNIGQTEKTLLLTPNVEPAIWRLVGSRSHAADRVAAFSEGFAQSELVPMGSSLKICLVAANQADLYPRFGPTSEWDTAAAQAVVECAGGLVLDDQLQPLRYNQKSSLLNPEFVVCQHIDSQWAERFSQLATHQS
ncbi:3'(2'), 5'-bisphosphate nucleotidase [Oceanospirillum multiglobuliferum]|uniref:3'(2'),5'-bisphosphate nucleotidase CysQ n=1 Tax=Oceanospirillum multiglobuliferum TaxID=64969 RepID=A0A1T4KGH3_9GAMM|nr:3'(2'),5'-bisphosphate nucleotidase CysQ [Oceanospirillum multiglobuliferum]OPX56025.1 3'(2'),5'-bisphosphate nucleotidase [Oceanospirillum multiglobuliferum]SJZ41457.1 3'(2'), 5'-bisphosphate nucleotidase [Oceanospirillum multiglobuliferum]